MIRTKALCVAAILLVGTSASASPEEVARIQRATSFGIPLNVSVVVPNGLRLVSGPGRRPAI